VLVCDGNADSGEIRRHGVDHNHLSFWFQRHESHEPGDPICHRWWKLGLEWSSMDSSRLLRYSGVARIWCQEGHMQKFGLLGFYGRQLSTYSRFQTLYRSKCSGKKLNRCKSRGARAPVPHSWRRQCWDIILSQHKHVVDDISSYFRTTHQMLSETAIRSVMRNNCTACILTQVMQAIVGEISLSKRCRSDDDAECKYW